MSRIALLLSIVVLTARCPGIEFRNVGPGGGGTLGCLAFEPNHPEVVYAGLDCGGMHVTTDGGQTWRNANGGIDFDGQLEWNNHHGVLALDGGRAFCTSNSGAIFSTDNFGQSWTRVFSSFGERIGIIVQNPHDPQVIYAAAGQGDGRIYVSHTGGAAGSWTLLNTDPVNSIPATAAISSLAVDGVNSSLLYAATDVGAYRSTDGGVSWTSIQNISSHPLGYQGKAVPRVMVTLPGVAGYVYVSVGFCASGSGVTPGVYRSKDSGANWSLIFNASNAGLSDISALAADPVNTNVMYVGSWDWHGGLYRSTNVRNTSPTWSGLVTYPTLQAQDQNGTLPAYNYCWHPERFHVSVGASLQVGGGDHDGDGRSDAIWFSGDNLGLIWKSLDGGRNWRQAVTTPKTVGEKTFWRGNGDIQLLCVRRILVDPVDPQTVYFTDFDWGQFQSRDGGESWAQIGGPWYQGELLGGGTDIVFDPDNSSVLFCGDGGGTQGGVLQGVVIPAPSFTIVGGEGSAKNGLPNGGVSSIVVARASTGDRAKYLYVPSDLNGVYRDNLDQPGWSWERVSTGLAAGGRLSFHDIVNVPGTRTFYLSTSDGIYRSDDGTTWQKRTGPGTRYPNLHDSPNLVVDPLNPDRVYVCHFRDFGGSPDEGLYLTEDGGTTWNRIAYIHLPYDAACVPLSEYPTVLVASQTEGVVKVQLDPDTRNWTTTPFANSSNGLANLRCWTVCVDPHNPRRYWIGTHGSCIFTGEETPVLLTDDFAGTQIDPALWETSGSVSTAASFLNAGGGGRVRSRITAAVPPAGQGNLSVTFGNAGTSDWSTYDMELGLHSADDSQYVKINQGGYPDWAFLEIQGPGGSGSYPISALSWGFSGPELRTPDCNRTWTIVLSATGLKLYVNDILRANLAEGQPITRGWYGGGNLSVPTAPLSVGFEGRAAGNLKVDRITEELLGPVAIQGRVVFDNFIGDNTTVGLKCELTPLDGGTTITRPVFLRADGSFTLYNVLPDTYTLTVQAKGTLTAVVNDVIVLAQPTVLAEPILLKGGDNNGDSVVTFEDFCMLQNNYGQGGAAPSGIAAAGAVTGACPLMGVLAALGLMVRFLVQYRE